MNRVGALSLFLGWDLFRSWAGLIPPVLTLGFFQATFYYIGNLDYFAGVGGGDMMIVCLVTSLLLVHRANRAVTYPLLARLRHRFELLCAIVLATLGIMVVMTALFVALILGFHKTTVTLPELLIILVRWLPLFLLATTLGLNMGKLVSRGGSHIITTGALAVLVTMNELRFSVLQGQNFLIDGIHWLPSPMATLLSAPVRTTSMGLLGIALLMTLVYATGLFMLATALFQHKDLLWAE